MTLRLPSIAFDRQVGIGPIVVDDRFSVFGMLPFRIQVAGIEYERIARDLIAALAGGGIGRRFDFEHSLGSGVRARPRRFPFT